MLSLSLISLSVTFFSIFRAVLSTFCLRNNQTLYQTFFNWFLYFRKGKIYQTSNGRIGSVSNFPKSDQVGIRSRRIDYTEGRGYWLESGQGGWTRWRVEGTGWNKVKEDGLCGG